MWNWILAVAVALGLAGATAAEPVAKPAGPTILISIDGGRADYLDRGVTPTLSALAKTGVRAAMRPSFPSLTFPNHYTLVTGLTPDHHGVVANNFIDRTIQAEPFRIGDNEAVADRRWWDGAEPIWVTAEKAGLKTATFFWPGSEARIGGVRPSLWAHFDAAIKPEHRVDVVLDWLDLPAAKRPSFITLYFDAVDHAGHAFGPDAPEVTAALVETDHAIARLVEGLKARGLFDKTNLVIVADHGMTAVTTERTVVLDKDMGPVEGTVVGGGPLLMIEPPADHAAEVAALLKPRAHVDCRRKADFVNTLGYGSNPRILAIVCVAEPGWLVFAKPPKGEFDEKGAHGFDPAHKDMAALFIAHGPAFAEGVALPSFPNVDVYPLLAKTLGVASKPVDGRLEEVKAALRP
jgi:predicted AlkP superfamily pyrophosphatase or phosphodiesterase